jgi:hypothetical protein
MALVSCPDCDASVSDASRECIHCGRPLAPSVVEAPAPPYGGLRGAAIDGYPAPPMPTPPSPPVSEAGELHAVEVFKLLLLSIVTLGMYEIFWFYRNWSRVRERGRDISPFWRAFFSPLWCFSLFDEVRDQADAAQVKVRWPPIPLALAYFVLSVVWRLPDPWWLLTFVSVLPMVPVQLTINELAVRRGVRPDATLNAKHIVVIVVGGIVLFLGVLGTIFPE